MKTSITRKQVREIHSALLMMSQRLLPTTDTDMKVGAALGVVRKVAEPIISARNNVVTRVVEGLGIKDVQKMVGLQQDMMMARIQEEQDKFDAELMDFEIDDKYIITRNDLPKDRVGDDGWKNRAANGAIIADLGPLFKADE
jgi:hypothetical protein